MRNPMNSTPILVRVPFIIGKVEKKTADTQQKTKSVQVEAQEIDQVNNDYSQQI